MTDQLQELLGKRLSRFRKAAGMTQEKLADRLSVANETVSRMERGTTAPSIKTLARIGEVLGVSLPDFFSPEGGASEKEKELDDLMTLLKRREGHEIQMVKEMAITLLEHLDRHCEPKPAPKKRSLPRVPVD